MTTEQTKELERLQLIQQEENKTIAFLQSNTFDLDDKGWKYLITAIGPVLENYKGTKADSFVMDLLSFLEGRRNGELDVKQWLEDTRIANEEFLND